MKPNKYELRHKQYLADLRRVKEIEKILKNTPLIPFDKPIHKGWYVYYELTEEVKRREDAFDIQQVVDIGYNCSSLHGRITNVKHVKRIRRGEKGYETTYKGKKYWHSYAPSKNLLSEKDYLSLPPQIKKHFELDKSSYSYIKYGRRYYKVWLPDYWLMLKCRPIIHTHYKERGGELERERDFLEDRIDMYWKLTTGGYKKSYPAHKDRAAMRAQIQKFKTGEVEDIQNHKVPLVYVW